MATWTESARTRQARAGTAPGQTVLFVDDEPSLRACMSAALTLAGYRVIQARDGREAVRVLLSQHIDLLVTDLIMPEQEGIETILFVRKNFLSLNVIVISGGDPVLLGAARKLGARAALCKPFSACELVAAVDSICSPAGSGMPGADEDWSRQG